ncbi:P1 family peptidase [Pontibacter sp. HSC-14F20]|uniref:DmpA family aminopeptidase n=1 Tax=Pontibacter sp. HSC-14F20 TaxID=2864136 RepID=UPI001C73B05B|nr:P1 family peptidase [Pontibacter sp. HSC-14F20]MBX0331921.1 P1 family peptidase [Pontibacter sp. HSC-14F20]
MKILLTGLLMMAVLVNASAQERKRARDYGIRIGVLQPGAHNAITDVAGLRVGHTTLVQGDNIRTGVTAILPHHGNLFQNKIPAAVYVGNGFGKLAGSTQVQELGNLESPIILTNTLGVGTAMNAVIGYTLQQSGNETVQSVNALVGETNDGYLNDIRGMPVREEHVQQAIKKASTGTVAEGNVGAGTGTVCFGYKGGIGTASRKLPASLGGYTVGVLVQSNFGGVLQIDGVPVGEELGKFSYSKQVLESADGSCMIVVATDAPLDARNLERIAKRAMLGLAKTGGIASNGSGDYVIAFSTNEGLRIPYNADAKTQTFTLLRNDEMSPLFMATIEATEEAIINSLFRAETMTGRDKHSVEALPIESVIKLLKKHNAIKR